MSDQVIRGRILTIGTRAFAHLIQSVAICFGLLLLLRVSQAEELTWEFSVQVSAQTQANPPAILFSWPQDMATLPDYYTVSRKAPNDSEWGPATMLPGVSTSYIDTNVTIGVAYEYQFYKYTSNHVGYGYVCSGIQLPLVEDRGKIILLVDYSFSSTLASELTRLQQDLVGDGWTVLRHDVARDASVPDIKTIVRNDYNADPGHVNALFLFGRIPVPYSGDMAPDGHGADGHLGAWPADAFYGDMDGVWTDTTVDDTTGSWDPRNQNVPGDGKYDQSEIPGTIRLEVGRVDLSNMPGIDNTGAANFPSEGELLRQYLNKDHNYRHKVFSLPARGLVYNQAGDRGGEAFADDAWRNWSVLLGPPMAQPLDYYQFLPTLSTNGYQWAYATSGADRIEMWYLGGTAAYIAGSGCPVDFFRTDMQTAFVMLLGSWFGDWDQQDDLMRGVLVTPTYGLASVYAGRPHWFFHYMGIGETLGFSARLTQNNHANGLYQNQSNNYAGFAHIALMGDPTLRLQPVATPFGLRASVGTEGVDLSWSPSADDVIGYHVYRADNPAGPFVRLTSTLVSGTTFRDTGNPAGTSTYMVRAVKLQSSPSGTYYNPSQGIFANLDAQPAIRLAVSGTNIVLTWPATPGRTYRILYTDSLVIPNWSPATDDLLATDWTIRWSISDAGALSGSGWVSTNSTQLTKGAVAWFDDALPAGAVAGPDAEPWNWVGSNPAPYSGTMASQSAPAAGVHQHYFTGATAAMPVGSNDVLVAYVYLDPANVPSEVMVQWYDGISWEHRAFWGADLITFGVDGTPGSVAMGGLPPTGQWVGLAVPASQVGLAGATVSGLAFTLYNGSATWDYPGKYSPTNGTTPGVSPGSLPPQRFYQVLLLP